MAGTPDPSRLQTGGLTKAPILGSERGLRHTRTPPAPKWELDTPPCSAPQGGLTDPGCWFGGGGVCAGCVEASGKWYHLLPFGCCLVVRRQQRPEAGKGLFFVGSKLVSADRSGFAELGQDLRRLARDRMDNSVFFIRLWAKTVEALFVESVYLGTCICGLVRLLQCARSWTAHTRMSRGWLLTPSAFNASSFSG